MDDLSTVQRELTDAEKNPVSSGLVEWHDPLDKPARLAEDEEDTWYSKLPIFSLLFSIAALCTSVSLPAACILGAAGLVCGIWAKIRDERLSGLQTAGIIISIAAIFIAVFLFVMDFTIDNGSGAISRVFRIVGGE